MNTRTFPLPRSIASFFRPANYIPFKTAGSRRLFAKLFLAILFASAPAICPASNPRDTLVGVIRWDGNTGDTPTFSNTNGNYVGQQVERAHGR
jgi:hypothetical protein